MRIEQFMENMLRAKKFLHISTVLIFIVVPLIFSTRLFNTFYTIKMVSFYVILLGMIPVSIYLFLKGGIERHWKNPIGIFIIFYLLINMISAMNSINPIISIEDVLLLLSYVIIYLIWTMNITREEVGIYFLAISISGVLASIYALLQHVGIDFPGIIWDNPELVRARSIGTFGNPTFLAGFLVMVLPVVMYLFIEADKQIALKKYFFPIKPVHCSLIFIIIWIICLLALLFTYTRGAWLAFFISHIFFVANGCKELGILQYPKKVFGIFLIFIIIIGVCVATQYVTKTELTIMSRILTIRDMNEIYNDRLFLWKIALFNFRDNFLLGTGPGTYSYIFPKYRFVEPVSNRGRVAMPESCHNEFLEIASSTGISGILSFLGIVVTGLYLAMKLMRASGNSERLKWICVLSCLMAYLVNNFFLYPTISTNLLWWFFLSLISLEFANTYPESSVKRTIALSQKVFLGIVSFVSLVLLIICLRIAWGNYLIKQAKNYEMEKKWRESYNSFNMAIWCDPGNYKYYQYKGKMLEGIFREQPLKNVTERVLQMYKEEVIGAYNGAILLNPIDPYCWADLARFYGYVAENYDMKLFTKAEEFYKKAIELDPYNPLFRNDIANLYAQFGKEDLALEYYMKGYELFPQSAIINYNIAVFYIRQKKIEKALIHVENALKADPGYKNAKVLLEHLKTNQ